MTEASEDGNYLVRVQAQVMTRDDSSGGWVPLSGGGLANVSVRRRSTSANIIHPSNNTNGTSGVSNLNTVVIPLSSPTTTTNSDHGSSSTSQPSTITRRHEYLIYGKRIKDQSVVLSCTIKKDFQYHKVMPTFHHWCTGEKKFGLTFQTAADARAFDKGVRTAVEELLEGLAETALCDRHPDLGDEGIFMTVNLPVDSSDTRQVNEQSRGIVRVSNYSQIADPLDPHKPIHYMAGGPSVKAAPAHHHPLETNGDASSDNYPYVQLTTFNHDYLYPIIDDHKNDHISIERRNSTSSLKKPDIIESQPTKNSGKKRGNTRLRCKHCQEMYLEHQNPKGSCEYSSDPIKKGIAAISCLSCARCMLYHCMSDAEGDFVQNPCTCNTEDGCGRRWFSLALLSAIVPCLWIYPPLRAIHWCGMACGICGGRHHPME